jgi:hypothetical protein
VVLTPRRWCQVGGSNSASDGGKRARFTGESTHETVKTIARGMSGDSGVLVVTTLACFTYFARKATGASRARYSPRPHFRGSRTKEQTSREKPAARMRSCVPASLRGAKATKQSSFLPCCAKAGLLRGACHRARIRATRWLAMTVLGCLKSGSRRTRRRNSSGYANSGLSISCGSFNRHQAAHQVLLPKKPNCGCCATSMTGGPGGAGRRFAILRLCSFGSGLAGAADCACF